MPTGVAIRPQTLYSYGEARPGAGDDMPSCPSKAKEPDSGFSPYSLFTRVGRGHENRLQGPSTGRWKSQSDGHAKAYVPAASLPVQAVQSSHGAFIHGL